MRKSECIDEIMFFILSQSQWLSHESNTTEIDVYSVDTLFTLVHVLGSSDFIFQA